MIQSYAHITSSSKNSSGNESTIESRSLMQLYSLGFEKELFPHLRLSAGGTFQKDTSDAFVQNVRTSSDSSVSRPRADLTLTMTNLTMGAGAYRLINHIESSAAPEQTALTDISTGYLSWKPYDLPTLDLGFTKTHSYDKEHASQDSVVEQISWASRYEPHRTVQLQYQGGTQDAEDRIQDAGTKTTTNSGRVSYGDRYFNDRVLFSSYYNVNESSTEVIAGGAGVIDFPVLAFDGLYASSSTPNIVQLQSTAHLINNAVNDANDSAINIGSGPFTSPPPQDTQPRNIGLRFSIATELNRLLVWVYSGNRTLTPSVAGSFAWGVYISADNQNWTLHQTVAAAPYAAYPAVPGAGRFEITFPAVKSLYIKVVVNPLNPAGEGLLFPVIAVTELQAFSQRPASQAAGTTRLTSQMFSAFTKVRLLNDPFLFYDASVTTTSSDAGDMSARTVLITNGLSASHRFDRVYSGTARIALTGDSRPDWRSTEYHATVSLQAVPLPSLKHSVAYSGGISDTRTGRSKNQSLYLANTAGLYERVSIYANGGGARSVSELDQVTTSTTLSLGAGISPAKTLSLNASSFHQRSEQSGGAQGRSTQKLMRNDAGLSYAPFSSLHLNAFISRISQNQVHDTLQNYGGTWSPLSGGSLQLGILYSESLRAMDNSVTKMLRPSIRWDIFRFAALDGSFTRITAVSNAGQTETREISLTMTVIL